VWKAPFADSGKQYGIPTNNYTMGLVINKKLFASAGLDPTKPPTTWQEVAADAKLIAAKNPGVYGYSDYSANHTGGWHFSAEIYSLGGDLVTADNKKADFNNDMGKAVLQNLYNMRWNDNSVGTKQLLQWQDLLTLAGAGKVGMYIGAPDSVTAIVQTFKGQYSDWAMGAMPGADGLAKAALAGGNGFLFRKGDSPAQIKAGLEWLSYEYLTPGVGQFDYATKKAIGEPVDLPEPQLFTADSAAEKDALKLAQQYATVDLNDYAAYVSNPIPPKAEAPNAQPIYAILDSAMSAVLTQRNANIPALLSTAEKQVNTLLSQPAAGS
jgi:ABC-type glycerol-3-phosphate transport system substrate-binding protein